MILMVLHVFLNNAKITITVKSAHVGLGHDKKNISFHRRLYIKSNLIYNYRVNAGLMSDFQLVDDQHESLQRYCRCTAFMYDLLKLNISLKGSSVRMMKIRFLSLCFFFTAVSHTLCAKWLTVL